MDIGHTTLFFERGGHSSEAEFMESGEGLFDEHGSVRLLRIRVVGAAPQILMLLG